MGYDKPDLGFVIHYQVPGSVVAYYQQVGRAGRALPSAYGVLLSGEEELAITDWFIRSAFPSREQVERLLEALEQGPEEGCTEAELLAQLNLPKGRLQQALKILSLETPAPIGKQGSRWQRLPAELQLAFWERVVRLTELRRAEVEQMQSYVDLSFGEHMAFLIEALDGDPSAVGPPPPGRRSRRRFLTTWPERPAASCAICASPASPENSGPQVACRAMASRDVSLPTARRKPARRSASGPMPVGRSW